MADSEKTLSLLNKRSEILEPLHAVAEELVEVDARGRNHLIEYTKLDVIAAASVFMHVLSNKKANEYLHRTDIVDLDSVRSEMEEYGERIMDIVNEMGNVDLGKGENNE